LLKPAADYRMVVRHEHPICKLGIVANCFRRVISLG
jgi:hypothetical protein